MPPLVDLTHIFNRLFNPQTDTLRVTQGDEASVDAFERLRVSNPSESLFDSQFRFGGFEFQWQTYTGSVPGGTVTYVSHESAMRLSVPTVEGASVIRQSYEYLPYQPGRSQLITMTGTLGAAKENLRTRIGYFDDQDGVFFQVRGGEMEVVLRSSSLTSGSVVEAVIPQSQWNMDRLDGTGLSKVTIDPAKAQIFVMDLQWLGVGRVRMGMSIDGKVVYGHAFNNANLHPSTYMRTGGLPVRYEIANVGATSSPSSITQICSSVISEGGFSPGRYISRADGRGTATVNASTRRPILSIRPAPTVNGYVNRIHIHVEGVDAVSLDAGFTYLEVVYGGVLTGASWVPATGSGSVAAAVEKDLSATVITGGTTVAVGYISGPTARTIAEDLGVQLPFTVDILGNPAHTFSLVATSFTGAQTLSGTFRWKEIY
jgi:hypothetical protein